MSSISDEGNESRSMSSEGDAEKKQGREKLKGKKQKREKQKEKKEEQPSPREEKESDDSEAKVEQAVVEIMPRGGQSDEEIHAVVTDARAAVMECDCGTREWREKQLQGIMQMISQHEEDILAALRADLGKCAYESRVTEFAMVRAEAEDALNNLRGWMSAQSVSTPLVHLKGLSSCSVQPQPKGLVLIISAWNYPFVLSLSPLVGAVAAGNAVVLKPSEVAPATSRLLAELLPRFLDRRAVRVIEGGVRETTALLRERFDHILYTGNGTVGRVIMRAAAEHLTPVTLELGGKSPCLVDEDASLTLAARRIAWGKWTNCGQTCIAPDYVLVHEKVADKFIELLVQQQRDFYGEDARQSADYGRIINGRHVDRIAALLEGQEERVQCGGVIDREARYVSPTVLVDVPEDAPVMRDEIFGPLLPILRVKSMDEAVAFVTRREKPLALYAFTNNKSTRKLVKLRTTSGQLVYNDCLVQFSITGLPFGGVGESGMGAYHGKHTFDCMSHMRAVVDKSTLSMLDLDVRYPPYTSQKLRMISMLL